MRAHVVVLCTVTLLCARAHADSAPVWLQVTTPHFTVVTDAPEKQARHIAGQFERMQVVFDKVLPASHSDSTGPIVVLALKNKRDFQTVEPAEYLAKDTLDLSGLFLQSGDRCYILLRLDAGVTHPYSTIYHEYTHYITRHARLPLWLSEGIAEFYENTDIESHEVHLGQPDLVDLNLLHSQTLIPLATLFTVDRDSPYYHDQHQARLFYAESWALTHALFLHDLRYKTSLIADYVRAVSTGQNSLTAAVTVFGDLRKLENTLSTEISRSDTAFLTLPTDIPANESSYKVSSLTSTDADAYRAAVLLSDGRTDDARKLLASVLAADPNNALAHESEGVLLLREHDLDAARKSFTQAVALHSTSFLAWYCAASLTLRSGNHDDPAIETELHQSLKLNPGFAPANNALASYYAMHRKLDEALRLNLVAIKLDPDNLNYQLDNASLHMQRNELPAALSVLEAARPLARTSAETAELDTRLDQIRRSQQEARQEQAELAAPSTPHTSTVTFHDNNVDPHYPDSPPAGPHHTAKGVLHNVQCTYPTILTLTVDGGARPIPLYTNHAYKIDYWVTFYPKDGLDPCKIEGMKATVTYTEVQDARVAGQILSIQVNR